MRESMTGKLQASRYQLPSEGLMTTRDPRVVRALDGVGMKVANYLADKRQLKDTFPSNDTVEVSIPTVAMPKVIMWTRC
jgi:hypothetical protein